jgi:hypothetical protein
VARVLLRVGSDIERWLLAPRQEKRIGEAAKAAFDEIEVRLGADEEVREDFRDPDDDSPAVELLEGVLRTAADEWEQRKVPYIGRIYAGLAFDASISPAECAYLIKVAERLTYQQVVLLAFWEAAQDSGKPYEQEVVMLAVRRAEGGARPAPTTIAEMDDLGSAGLLGVATERDGIVRPGATFGSSGGFTGVDLNTVRATEIGQRLHRLMGLERVADSDLDAVMSSLRGQA